MKKINNMYDICKEKLEDVIGGSTSYILKKANLNKKW